MKNLFLLVALLPCLSWAQEVTVPDVPTSYLSKSVWRLEFFGPGIINESRLGRQTTFVSQFRFVMSPVRRYQIYEAPYGSSRSYSAYTINPQLSLAVRQFYNFARRLDRGKSIRYNSGNYVTAKFLYNMPPVIRHDRSGGLYVPNINGVGGQILWGFQRTYRRNFYLNLELGLGTTNRARNAIGVASYFTLGYTFKNKQS